MTESSRRSRGLSGKKADKILSSIKRGNHALSVCNQADRSHVGGTRVGLASCAGRAPDGVGRRSGAACAAPEPVAGSGEQIADIVVVGEKRSVNLQSAPLAISAISADALRERNVVDVADLNGFVPGLTVSKSEGNERVIAIRGIGYETAQNPNSQPGVAFHIDGVYIAHVVALNQDLLDVDHVEVLRGPQGTVFGQTSTGGAINVITRKPVFDRYTGEASVSYGNYNYVRTEGTLNVPLAQNLAIRGTVQYLRHDGYGYATQVPGYSKFGLDDADDLGAHVTCCGNPNRISAWNCRGSRSTPGAMPPCRSAPCAAPIRLAEA
jgi:iron complex outermembrane receptor protein